jgi:HEAT repeat protein
MEGDEYLLVSKKSGTETRMPGPPTLNTSKTRLLSFHNGLGYDDPGLIAIDVQETEAVVLFNDFPKDGFVSDVRWENDDSFTVILKLFADRAYPEWQRLAVSESNGWQMVRVLPDLWAKKLSRIEQLIYEQRGKEANELLISFLKDESAMARRLTATGLGRTDRSLSTAKALLGSLNDPDRQTRIAAGASIKMTAIGGDLMNEAFRDILHDPNRTAFEKMITARELVANDAVTPELVNEVISLLSDDEAAIRRDAAELLGNIGKNAQSSTPALFQVVEAGTAGTENGNVSGEAVKAIVKIDPSNTKLIPTLLDAIGSANGRLPWLAAKNLAKLDPDGTKSSDVLIRYLASPDSGVRLAALKALSIMQVQNADLLDALIVIVENETDEGVFYSGIRILVKIDPPARKALPALEKAMRSRSSEISYLARRAHETISSRSGAPTEGSND